MRQERPERTIATRSRCRVPRCTRAAECRGLCRSCYQSAYQLVTAELVTWEQLEKQGKVEPVFSVKSWFLAS